MTYLYILHVWTNTSWKRINYRSDCFMICSCVSPCPVFRSAFQTHESIYFSDLQWSLCQRLYPRLCRFSYDKNAYFLTGRAALLHVFSSEESTSWQLCEDGKFPCSRTDLKRWFQNFMPFFMQSAITAVTLLISSPRRNI